MARYDMRIDSDYVKMELPRGGAFVVSDAQGMRLSCLGGVLWITQHHDSNDLILKPAQSATIRGKGAVVIQACAEASALGLRRLPMEAGHGLGRLVAAARLPLSRLLGHTA